MQEREVRVAVYGGSFDPPHVGHAMVASWIVWTGRADVVWWLPTGAHAFGKTLSPFARRAAWVHAQVEALGPAHVLCDLESRLPPPSYTVATLDALATAHPEHAFSWVVGSDQHPGIAHWHESERLHREHGLIWVGREGFALPDGTQSIVVPNVSSTAVRAGLVSGEDVSQWVSVPVLAELTVLDVDAFAART